MIRNALFGPPARALRAGAWSRPGGAIESTVEYGLYLFGWLFWVLDWLFRAPALVRHATGGLAPGVIVAEGIVLLDAGASESRSSERARAILAQAAALLSPYGIRLEVANVGMVLRPGAAPFGCGLAGLLAPFFPWASARGSVAPTLTVYFVEDLGRLAGCAYPGTDWILVDLGTDGTTVVHEIGHLADLWPHSPDPRNVMTDRPGGTHDGLTPLQAAFIRTSRFVRRDKGGDAARTNPSWRDGG